ncbi:hypothetical protein [Puerhibacterium sp. TATVAM-FAB25]|uniref:hypothetical protein n=1 Tax=Puerhibacterium sp. TATVAM-FAB25 TaxID=3093699 RepID=UPI0039787791
MIVRARAATVLSSLLAVLTVVLLGVAALVGAAPAAVAAPAAPDGGTTTTTSTTTTSTTGTSTTGTSTTGTSTTGTATTGAASDADAAGEAPEPTATPERPLVVAGVAGLEWSDLDRTRTPRLWALVAGGDVASIAVRTLSPTCPVDAWLTLSAGNRVTSADTPTPPDAATAEAAAPVGGTLRCPQEPAVRADATTADGTPAAAQVSGWSTLVAPETEATGSYGRPGTLGDALGAAGQCATAIGPGAAVALAGSDGQVQRYLPGLPARPEATEAAEPTEATDTTGPTGGAPAEDPLPAALTACPVSVVDLGSLPDPAAERAEALRDLDAAVGRLVDALPQGGRLLVAGVADTPLGPRGLQVAVDSVRGDGAAPSWLSSGSSRREGVVVVNDLSATVAAAAGLDTTGFDGSALERGEPRRLDTAGTVENRRYLTTLTETTPHVSYALLGTLVLAAVVCLPVLLRRSSPRARRQATALLTVAAMLPAGASLATLSRWWSSPAPGPVLAAATVLPAVALALAAWAAERGLRRSLPDGAPAAAWRLPLVVAGLTWLVLTADGLTGTTLQQGSPLGPSLALGARFYGFGNTVFAVYATAAVVLAAGLAAAALQRGRRRTALAAVAGVGLVTVLVDGLPALGADAGGIVSLVPAFVVLGVAVAGRRVRLRHLALAAGAALVVVAVIAVAAWLLPGPGSHLSRFVQRLADGDAAAVVAAKAAGAWHTVASVPGAAATLLVVAAAWAVLAPARRPWSRVPALRRLAAAYGERPVLRAGVVALVVVAAVGSLLNDTGVAVAFVVLVLAAAMLGTGLAAEAPATAPAVPTSAAAPSAGSVAAPAAAPTAWDPDAAGLVRRTPTTIVTVGGGVLVAFLLVVGMVPPSSGTGVAGGQSTALGDPEATAVAAPASSLVVVGTAGMRWSDVRPDAPVAPTLAGLLADGADAAGVALPTGAAARCVEGGWLALSAGQLAEAATTRGADGAWACPPLAAEPGGTAEGAVVAGWDALQALQQGSSYGARLGRLGTALAGAPACATAVGPGAAVALADGDGAVARYRDVEAAEARGSDAFDCPVTVVDAGSAVVPRDATDQQRADAVAAVDDVVADVLDAVPASATVVVVDVANVPGSQAALGLGMVRPSADLEDRPRYLSSTATRTDGVVRLLDVPATVLRTADAAVPATLDDTPLARAAVRPPDATATADELADLTDRDHVRRAVYTWLVDVPFYAGLALAAACLLAARTGRGRGARAWRWAEGAALALSALPAASFLGALVGWWRFSAPLPALVVGTALTTAVVAGLGALAPRRPLWAPLGVVAGVTFAVLTLDGLLGTPLNRASPLGSAPTFGARFYGFGNPTFSIYAVAGLLFAAAVAQWFVRRGRPVLAAAAVGVVGLVAMVVDVWPTLGADLGGGLVLVPAFVIIGLAASGARVTLRRFSLVAAAGVAAVAAVGVLDWLRPEAARSHLGRFVAQVVDGEAWGILARKASYALRSVLGGVPVWLTIVVLVAAAVPLLAPARVRARWTPGWFTRAEERWPLLRPAVLAIWAMAVLGSLVNDFGVRIALIALVPAIPMITLAALQARGGRELERS